jgi:hypothetical protein
VFVIFLWVGEIVGQHGAIARALGGAHIFPKYGVGFLLDHVNYVNALDEFQAYFVNPYIDHHCYEFLSD